MAERFRMRIYTPEKMVFDNEIESLVVQGLDGQLCVQAHHMPAVFALDTGFIRARDGEETRQFAATEGFVDVDYNRAYIFVDACVESDGAEQAEAELTRLKARERSSVREHKRSAITLARTLSELSRKDKKRRGPEF